MSGDRAMRPQTLSAFVGQDQIKDNLKVFIDAARDRYDALDHALMLGPPGLGKTTLAEIIARELKVGFRATTGPVLTKPADLAAILINLEARDVLFIDEIHGLSLQVSEMLYTAMEDYSIDIVLGEGQAARTVRIELAPFTLLGATTHPGLLAAPLRDRFGIPLRLEFYTPAELVKVQTGMAAKMGVRITEEAALEVAKRARGTPRIAGRLLRRLRDFARGGEIDKGFALDALGRLRVDAAGLESQDRRYLRVIGEDYGGGPVGLETLAASLAEGRGALESMIEPYLMQKGFVQRTGRGRALTDKGFAHIGLKRPEPV